MEELIWIFCCVILTSSYTTSISQKIRSNNWVRILAASLFRKLLQKFRLIIILLTMIDMLIHNWVLACAISGYILIAVIVAAIAKELHDFNENIEEVSYRNYW